MLYTLLELLVVEVDFSDFVADLTLKILLSCLVTNNQTFFVVVESGLNILIELLGLDLILLSQFSVDRDQLTSDLLFGLLAVSLGHGFLKAHDSFIALVKFIVTLGKAHLSLSLSIQVLTKFRNIPKKVTQ